MWYSSLGVWHELTSHCKNNVFRGITQGLITRLVIRHDHGKEKWTRDLVIWNVRSMTGTLGLMTSEIEEYRMDVLGVQEVR